MQFFYNLLNESNITILISFIALDSIFGVLRAIKEHKINSNIGIDGLIRKFGMIISLIFFLLFDKLLNFNLIGFIPEEIRTYINIENFGISELFLILYIVFEALSILKNMIKCKLPIPKKLQKTLENLLENFTSEGKE